MCKNGHNERVQKRQPCARGVGGEVFTKALLHETHAFAPICVSASVDSFACPSRNGTTNRRLGVVDPLKRGTNKEGLSGLLFYVFQVAEGAVCVKRAVTATMQKMSNIFCVRVQHALPFSKAYLRSRDETRVDAGGGTP